MTHFWIMSHVHYKTLYIATYKHFYIKLTPDSSSPSNFSPEYAYWISHSPVPEGLLCSHSSVLKNGLVLSRVLEQMTENMKESIGTTYPGSLVTPESVFWTEI